MMMSRLVVALGLFLVVAGATLTPPSHRWDVAVTTWLQRAAPAPDHPAGIFVFLGDAEISISAVALAALLVWRRAPGTARTALWLAVGMTAVSFIALALKFVIPHPGPPAAFQRPVLFAGPGIAQPYSFPSGHTMRITFLAAGALGRAPAAAAVLVLAMMAALVYLGDHWMSDVAGGLCLGWACAETARLLRPAA